MPWSRLFRRSQAPTGLDTPSCVRLRQRVKHQEYLGSIRQWKNWEVSQGGRKLGFDNVGIDKRQVLLEKAAKGNRVYY